MRMKRPYRKSRRHRFDKVYRTQAVQRRQWRQIFAILVLILLVVVGSRTYFEFVYGSYQGRWRILPAYIITLLLENFSYLVLLVISVTILSKLTDRMRQK